MKRQKITIIGTGYVGVSSAAIFANCGYDVVCLDVDQRKVDSVNDGKSFFYEHGIDPLLAKGIADGTLSATTSYPEAIADADFIFSCVGTPDRDDGSVNLDYVFSAAEEAAKNLTKDVYFIQKSTVPVGTGRKVIDLFAKMKDLKHEIKYLSNPEFLRESTSVYDTINADRIVVGGDINDDIETVLDIYRVVEDKKDYLDDISQAGVADVKTKYVATSIESAELIKVTANSFLALKISFANSIAKLADQTGGNIKEIMEAVGMDQRIGRAFLNAGRGYGGGCFPKDVKGLIASTEEYGLSLDIMKAADQVNASMATYIVDQLRDKAKHLKDKKVCLIGLSFKEGTSDVRKSPPIEIANLLIEEGAKVTAFDPEAMEEAKQDRLSDKVKLVDSVDNAAKEADIFIVGTMWEHFKELDLKKIKQAMNGNVFVDCMNGFDRNYVIEAGFEYLGVGNNT